MKTIMFDVSKIPNEYENQIEQKAFENAVQCIYYGFQKSEWNYLCLGKCKQNEIWKRASKYLKDTYNGRFCHACRYFVKNLNLCNYSVPVSCMALDEACMYFEEVKKNEK